MAIFERMGLSIHKEWSTYTMQASTAASSSNAWLFIKGIGKTSFPQIRRERIGTASAGPKGERQGWRRIESPCAFVFLIGSAGYRFI
jgi:hypothetical protein